MRKLSREVLFKLIFAKNYGVKEDDSQNFDELLNIIVQNEEIKPDDLDMDYLKQGFQNITDCFSKYVELISQNVKKYKSSRIYNADIIILAIAIFEYNVLKLEKKIVISEAIKLAKKYSTEQSIKFINGVLSAVLKDENE